MLGFFGLLVVGIVVLSLLPTLYPDDRDERRAIRWAFWGVTILPVVAVVLWLSVRRLGRLVAGIIVGYFVWSGLLAWFAATAG